jgi:minor curlin subunit
MKHLPGVACGVLLALCCAGAGPASAQTSDIKTIVSVGGPPVVLNQNSQLNLAGVFMIGGSTSATVVQHGTNNATGILQFGGTNSASVGQAGGVGPSGRTGWLSAIDRAAGLSEDEGPWQSIEPTASSSNGRCHRSI